MKKDGDQDIVQQKFVSEEDKKYDFRDYLAKEGDDDGFHFVSANEEALEKARDMMAQMEFAGGRKDIDKKLEKMNVDEKEVFNLIDGDEINDFR